MKGRSIEDLERRVREHPDDVELRVALAYAFREAGRILDAATTCRQALARAPEHAGAQALLSELEPARAQPTARPPGVPDSRSGSGPAPKVATARPTYRGPPPPAAQVRSHDTLEQPVITPVDAPAEVESGRHEWERRPTVDERGRGDTVADEVTDPSASNPVALNEVTDPSARNEATDPSARNEVTGESASAPESESTDPDLSERTRLGVGFVGGAGEEDPLELVRAFDRPFAEALSALRAGTSSGESGADVFPELPDQALAQLARGMAQRQFQKGELILREGEPGDACFVIVSGGVRILKRDPLNPRGDLIEVNRLADGAFFGEFALLSDRRRHATVQATENSSCYEIPRRLLRRLASDYPGIGPALERFYRDRLLATLLATAPFFKPLEPDLRGELLAHFQPHRVEAGERVITEGERAGGFYLIVLGSVEITKQVEDGQSVPVATLGEGAYFGEMSLLRGDVAQASVTAEGPVELAMLPPKDFYTLVADHPVLWNHIRDEARRREMENYQLVTGVTGSS